jgi:plasmid stability protein
MITITIKGIPKQTHRELKKRAAAHRRSLNNEVICVLESSLGEMLENAKSVRYVDKTVKTVKKVVRRK